MSFLPDNVAQPGAGLGEGGQPPGNTQAQFQNLSRLTARAKLGKDAEPLYVPFDIAGLAAGQTLHLRCDSGVPDSWIISFRPVANTRISVFLGPQDQGSPHRLGGGGSARLPALSEDLTIVSEVGGATAIGTVIAVRNMDVMLNGGNV